MTEHIVIPSVIVDVRELHRRVRAFKADPKDPRSEVIDVQERLGWFIRMQGSYEHLYVGDSKPQLAIGDHVEIRISKRSSE